MKTLTLKLSKQDAEKLVELLQEKAMEIEDDGREGHPDAKLLWSVAREMKTQMPECY